MTDRQQDPELSELFEAQRRDDAREAPSFAAMMERAHAEAGSPQGRVAMPATRTRWRRYRAGALAAAAIAAVIMIPRMRAEDDSFEQAVRAFQSDPALGAWRSPTDGLLNLPGDRLLSTIPDVGTETQ